MKKIIIITAVMLMSFVTENLFGQTLQMFYTEPSGYPYMTTGFKIFDATGTEIRNSPTPPKPIKKENIIITETQDDGTILTREVLDDPNCPSQTLTTFSAVLVVDISQSMSETLPGGTTKMDAAKEVLKDWARNFDSTRTETAITAFCGDAIPSVDFPNGPIRTFTTDKDSLLLAIDRMPNQCAGTNYNAAFLYQRMNTFITQYSGLYWCRPDKRRYKPVIIFLTDGNHLSQYGGPINGGVFNIDSVLSKSYQYNVTIYVIQFGTEPITDINLNHLNQLSFVGKAPDDNSPNIWLGVNSATELKGIYQQILNEAGKIGDPPPCYVSWKGGCEGGSATFTFTDMGPGGTDLVGVSDYIVNPNKKPNLNINPRNPVFSNVAPGSTPASMTVTLKAEKNFVEITGIDILDASLVGDFSVVDWGPSAPPPFVIPRDSSYKIVIEYNPQDSSCSNGVVEFLGSACTGRDMTVKGEMLPFVEEIDMGNVNVGGTKSATFTQVFCNKTCQDIQITSKPKITGTDASNFSVIKPTGTVTLKPGDCLKMEFQFNPNEPAGTKKAKIEIKTDYNNQTFSGNITGNAVGGKTVIHD
ncbi:MAG: choice-of-anchor D domain-containing protein, partial [bacterium]